MVKSKSKSASLVSFFLASLTITGLLASCSDSTNTPHLLNTSNEAQDSQPKFSPAASIDISRLIDSLCAYQFDTSNSETISTNNRSVYFPEGAVFVGAGFDSESHKRKQSAVEEVQASKPIGTAFQTSMVKSIKSSEDLASLHKEIFTSPSQNDKYYRFDSLYLQLFTSIIPKFDSTSLHFVMFHKSSFDNVSLNSAKLSSSALNKSVDHYRKSYGNSYISQVKPVSIYIQIFSVNSNKNLGNNFSTYLGEFTDLVISTMTSSTNEVTPFQNELLKNGIRVVTISTLSELNSSIILTEKKAFKDTYIEYQTYYNEQISSGKMGKVHTEYFRILPYHILPGSEITDSTKFPIFK